MKLFFLFHLIAVLCTTALFIQGFFPIKKVSHGFATQKVKIINSEPDVDDPSNGSDSTSTVRNISSSATGPSSYRRLILMVIDALRADFAFGPFNYLPNTYEIIRNSHGLQFVAKTNPPTVTLPRIKAITTGSPPSFVDVALNFGSPALEEDNIVTQMKRSGREIIFFGDDTWINLFPEHFERSDGTTSFFVSDYKEVDTNVTRHLKHELNNPSWDVMILHYLGLDHIGHTAGPSSSLVKPKLKEMDNIILQIYSAMEQWAEPSLLVVCGDHGMSDQGGHGGASAAEISVPVIFLSPHIISKDSKHVEPISQADLCPTLSVLLGLPIPKNNVGKVVTEALIGCTLPQKVSVIHQNAVQAIQILKGYVQDLQKESSYLLYSKAKDQFHRWLSAKNSTPNATWEDEGHILLTMYSESLNLLAEKVTRLSTQYDVYALAVAVALLWMLLISLILSHCKKNMTTNSRPVFRYASQLIIAISTCVLSHITMCTGGVPSDLLCQATFMSIGIQLFVGAVFVVCLLIMLSEGSKCVSLTKQYQAWTSQICLVEMFLLFGTLSHSFTLLSTSFVEEEHQIFYFLTTSVHILLLGQTIVRLLKSHKDKCHLNAIQNSANNGCKNYAEINSSGETCRNSFEGDDRGKTVQAGQCGYIQGMCQAGDSSCSDTVKTPRLNSSISTDKESSNTLPADAPATNFGTSKKSNLKEKLINLIEFLHVSASIVSVLILLRVLRRWNQTGNKWLDIPDFGDWLILPENKMFLSLVVVFSMLVIGASQGRHMKRVQSMSVNLALATIYLYHVAVGSLFFPTSWFLSPRGIMEARASFIFLTVALVMSILPTNCFRLEPKEDLLKSLPAIRESTSQIYKVGYCPVLGHSITPQQSQSTGRNLIIGQKLQNMKSVAEHTQVPSSEYNQTLSSGHNQTPSSGHNQSPSSKHAQAPSSVTMRQKVLPTISKSRLDSPSSSSQTLEDGDDSVFNTHQRLRGVAAVFLCFMCLVLRPHNIATVALMSLVEQMMTPVLINSHIKPTYILLYCLWMGQAFFFFQGNSNSLSTLDLTAGYRGLYEFTPAITGALLCLATYAGTIFWILTYLRIVCLICDTDTKGPKYRLPDLLTRACGTLLLCRALPLSVYTTLVSTQRYHLFVWTVFSPKLLYEGANTFVTYALSFMLLVYSLFKS